MPTESQPLFNLALSGDRSAIEWDKEIMREFHGIEMFTLAEGEISEASQKCALIECTVKGYCTRL